MWAIFRGLAQPISFAVTQHEPCRSFSGILKGLFPACLVFLCGCDDPFYDGENLRGYLPKAKQSSELIFARRKIGVCALAIFQVSDDSDFSDLNSVKLENDANPPFTAWMEIASLDSIADETIVGNMISNGNSCWSSQASEITERGSLYSYKKLSVGYFANNGRAMLIYDLSKSNLIAIGI